MLELIAPHVTVDRALIAAVLLLQALSLAWGWYERRAAATPEKEDDAFVAKVNAWKSWAKEVGPGLYRIVKLAVIEGKIDKAKRWTDFLDRLQVEWSKDGNPGAVPAEAVNEARRVVDGLHAEDKAQELGGITIPLLPPAPQPAPAGAPSDPQPAPGSR